MRFLARPPATAGERTQRSAGLRERTATCPACSIAQSLLKAAWRARPRSLGGRSLPTQTAEAPYFRVTPGTAYPFTWIETVTNKGPSATLFGGSAVPTLGDGYGLTVDGGGMEISTQRYPDWPGSGFPFQVDASPPFGPCTSTYREVQCRAAGWLNPGSSSTITVKWLERAPTDVFSDNVTSSQIHWSVARGGSSTAEIDPSNNSSSATAVFCWPDAKAGGCAAATPP